MDNKISLRMDNILQDLRSFDFPPCDLVVGISSGGTVPAKLIAGILNRPVRFITINFRDFDNQPRHFTPQLVKTENIPSVYKKILLVDDVSVSGKTLALAFEFLKNFEVKTFVLKGKAEYVLYPNIKSCVDWPWKKSDF